MENDIMKYEVRVRKARKSGPSTVISLTGYVKEGRHYSIRKHNNFVVLEDIEDELGDESKTVSDSVIESVMNKQVSIDNILS